MRLFKYYVVAQPVPQHDLTPSRRGRTILVSEATTDGTRDMAVDRPRHVIDQRLLRGCRCIVAHRNGEAVGFQWFTLRDYLEDEVRCMFRLRPEDRCAWDFDVFVLPSSRAQPVFSRLWDTTNAILREAGVDTSLSRINAFNPASRRAHARLGASTIAWGLFFKAWALQLALLSCRPWLHISLSDASIPAIDASQLARVRRALGPARSKTLKH